MTLITVRPEARPDMIGILRRLVTIDVTPLTVRRRTGIFLPTLSYVTGITIGYGVDTLQGEASCRMDLEYVLPILPMLRGVTILTFGAQLSSVNIRVTICTFPANPG